MADVNSTSMISIIAIIISLIISLVFPFVALFWIRKLDSIQCKCSENWKRDYMEWYLYFIIALELLWNPVSLLSRTTLSTPSFTSVK